MAGPLCRRLPAGGAQVFELQGHEEIAGVVRAGGVHSTTGPVVIVEGPTDVWRLGPGAVALFGKDMSLPQQALLDQHLPGRHVVVMLDRDVQDNATNLRSTLLNRGVTVLAGLPDGRDDVGDCTTEEAWQQVELALATLR